MVDSIIKEIELKSGLLKSQDWETIYFGGGTPSLLKFRFLESIIKTINNKIPFSRIKEFTFEMNPEHVSNSYLNKLADLGVTRISLGIQTFSNRTLSFLNRGHNKAQAVEAMEMVKSNANLDLTIDLIFGIPNMGSSEFKEDLEIIGQISPEHLSAYSLTIEEKTKFGLMEKKGTLIPLEDEEYLNQFLEVDRFFTKMGFEHYEISNYALPGKRSIHNSNYWSGAPYEGFGPSAHSFSGNERKWNVSNNGKYIQSLINGVIPEEKETLSSTMKANEMIMTSLRTARGLNLKSFQSKFNLDLKRKNQEVLGGFIKQGMCTINDEFLTLTLDGWYISDEIISKLFFSE